LPDKIRTLNVEALKASVPHSMLFTAHPILCVFYVTHTVYFRTFNILNNKMHTINALKHKSLSAHFMFSANSCMFKYQGAILSQFNNNKGLLSPTHALGAGRAHFHH